MVQLTQKRSQKSGLPPGSLIYIGSPKTRNPEITLLDYNENKFEEKKLNSLDEFVPYKENGDNHWINVDGLHHVAIVQKLGEYFGLHPLVMEDILNTEQRPKMGDLGPSIFLILRSLSYNVAKSEIVPEQVSFILTKKTLLSFQEFPGDEFGMIRERLKNHVGRISRMGTDYLVYSLIDAIVDNYFLILERLNDEIEALEGELLGKPNPKAVSKIHHLKRELILFRKCVWPLREVLNGLLRSENPLIQDSVKFYLKDIYEHVIDIIDTIEIFRETVSGMLELYLSNASNRLNEVMKVLTIISTIFMPLTFIVGVYGMNFQYLPELHWKYGYFLVWGIMISIFMGMLYFFKKKKWI